jgi:hypothetical protein
MAEVSTSPTDKQSNRTTSNEGGSLMEFNDNQQSTPADERLADEVLSVLGDAAAGLTEEEILAIVTIRRERELMSCLEDLVLQGELGVTLERPQDGPVTSQNFSFYAFTEEERAERPKRVVRRSLLHRVLRPLQSLSRLLV